MKAMVLNAVGKPLEMAEVDLPKMGPNDVLIKTIACGVCRTDLHIVDGELPSPKLPLILGHQVVGKIEAVGENVRRFQPSDLVGASWLGNTCHCCEYCLEDKENLCDGAVFTGYHKNGGYAEYCAAHEDYIFALPKNYRAEELAPMLCAGLIGYRAYRLTQKPKKIGLYGFGSSAHLLIQLATAHKHDIYVFTRPNDTKTQEFALSLQAKWAGGSDQSPPVLLDAAILFAPDGSLYPKALKDLKKGGIVISAGIHMSDIPSFPYQLLWEERVMTSVANLTRKDGEEFFSLLKTTPIRPKTHTYPLKDANIALQAIRTGALEGSAVLLL
ncbi:MAG: alcohol dehydrogenase [Chlamydiae bacterium CG10_big_fil_rev_8_21_14_0_10_42_34]|nr:MAG: alcohol dehydrogenase [Chlamydiae bacterium CG10_big_fil_rev_8_21_14_0_10_42_34]